jgi:hypothetical protein
VASEAAAMLAEPGPIAALLEEAGLPPESLPAALARADQCRADLGRDAAQGGVLASIVNRIELSPIGLRVSLSLTALLPSPPEAPALREAVLTRNVRLRIKRRGVEMRLVIEGPSAAPAKPDPVLVKEIRRRIAVSKRSSRVRPAASPNSPPSRGSAIGTSAWSCRSPSWPPISSRRSPRGASLPT